ncbi:MAG: DUF3347 domain-containing protein [Proteobacteria bacterium]|nr:DUF3347 domain-containing protein [Pseudomonadota bacterium]NDC25472.1 DUF3347 domain-containing protein [Pseudomonadota bacterium]NDD05457.1 DUF3347 domain-containing protein [Pseudomonadota bacterium]NDG26449.1 DUF3347 domain-containing protein [Pseudomonadota bacterium]
MRHNHWIFVICSAFLTGSPVLLAQNETVETLLKSYSAIQHSLAGDKVTEAQTLAQKALNEITEASNSAEKGQVESLKKMELGTQQLAQSKSDGDSRKAFGLYSEGTVSLIRANETSKAKWQLFYCPMVPKGTYGYWVQPKGEGLLNPYYGAKMLTCGVKRPW